MRTFLTRVKAVPLNLRLGGLLALVLLVGFSVWLFFLRGGGNPLPPAPPVRPALGKTITLADYRAGIQTAVDDVRAAQSASDADRKAAVQRVIADLQGVEGASIVEQTGGPTLAQADNTRLLLELAQDDPNLIAVDGSLTLLLESLDKGPAGHLGEVDGTVGSAQARALLSDVLSNPVYDYNRSRSPLEELARWIASLTGESDPENVLSRLLLSTLVGIAIGSLVFLLLDKYLPNRWARLGISTVAGLMGGGLFYAATDNLDVVVQVLTAVGLGVAAIAAAVIMAGLNRGSAPGSVHTVSDLASVLGMSASEARRRAVESAAEGDYRSAIRYRCLAVLLALDEAGMLVFDRTATNREYLFRAPGPLHDSLQMLLSRFEEIWYGNSETNAAEWEQYNARAAAVEAEIAPQTRPKAA